jgi:hypothetical protein
MEHDSVYWSLIDYTESDNIEYGNILMYGDSILNGHHYKKLYLDNIRQHAPNLALIREENKRIYLRALGLPEDTTEDIVCDFNLQAGDTFNDKVKFFTGDTSEYTQLIVGNIDSVLLKNGQYRKTYQLYGTVMGINWVEEFGSVNSLPFVYNYNSPGWDSYSMRSIFSRDTLVYCNPANKSCNSGINDKLPKAKPLKIYPNPARNYICIADFDKIDQKEIMHYSIYDMSGKCLMKDYLHEDKTISVSALPAGSYLLKITGKNKLYESVFQK